MMTFDRNKALELVAADRAKEQPLPGDPLEAIQRARAAMAPKKQSLSARMGGLFRKKDKGFGDLRSMLAASVTERRDVLEEVAEKLPVDPPEVAYLAQRRAAG
jgi:hypothetical protein